MLPPDRLRGTWSTRVPLSVDRAAERLAAVTAVRGVGRPPGSAPPVFRGRVEGRSVDLVRYADAVGQDRFAARLDGVLEPDGDGAVLRGGLDASAGWSRLWWFAVGFAVVAGALALAGVPGLVEGPGTSTVARVVLPLLLLVADGWLFRAGVRSYRGNRTRLEEDLAEVLGAR